MRILLTLLLLFVLLVFRPLFVSACTCYDSTGTAVSLSADTACENECGDTDASEMAGDPGICGTDSETSCGSVDCATVCTDGGYSDTSAVTTSSSSNPTVSYPTPQLEIKIPGVSFTAPFTVLVKDGTGISSNFIGQYISGVYKFLIGFAIVIAIVMMMIGGLQYVAGASSGDIEKAKSRIRNAVEGFVLLLFVYVILFTVNPNTTLFPNLSLLVIPETPFSGQEDAVTVGDVAVNFATLTNTNISGGGMSQVPTDLSDEIERVAEVMRGKGYGISLASGYRTVEKQTQIIKDTCNNPPGASSCDPKVPNITACMLIDGDPKNCPHTTGRALDIWGTKSVENRDQAILQKPCASNLSACRSVPAQAALIAAMKAEGFCNLASEAWHFEKPKMSSTCN